MREEIVALEIHLTFFSGHCTKLLLLDCLYSVKLQEILVQLFERLKGLSVLLILNTCIFCIDM